jgi:hypothetical protein
MNEWHKDLFGMLLVAAVINFIVRCLQSIYTRLQYPLYSMTNDKDHE